MSQSIAGVYRQNRYPDFLTVQNPCDTMEPQTEKGVFRMKKGISGFLLGLCCGGLLFGGSVAYATGIIAIPIAQSGQTITVDGTPVSLAGYNINGNNYFQLGQLGQLMGFGVHWNAQTQTVELSTQSQVDASPSASPTVSLPTDGSRYVPSVGDVLLCEDGSEYTITNIDRFENNIFAPDFSSELPIPTCDWSQFPTTQLPDPIVRRFYHETLDSDEAFVLNQYETRRMQYTLYNALGNGSGGSVVTGIPTEYANATRVFWPWREQELEKQVAGRPNGTYYVEAWDCYCSGIFQYTRYFLYIK